MAVSEETNGTQVATVGTEHTLHSPATAGTRVLRVDLAPLVSGDVVELRVKVKGKTGGTERVRRLGAFQGPIGEEKIYDSEPIPMPLGGAFSLKQTTGTSRSFDWSTLLL